MAAMLPDLDWSKVYGFLGEDMEYLWDSKLRYSSHDSSEDFWPIIVAEGITLERLFFAFRSLKIKLELPYCFDDLALGMQHDRDPSRGSYIVNCRKRLEADPRNAGRSADECAAFNICGITLLERLLLEVAYFLATEKKCLLDLKTVTLCGGSKIQCIQNKRYIPSVDCYTIVGNIVCIRLYDASRHIEGVRVRAVSDLRDIF